MGVPTVLLDWTVRLWPSSRHSQSGSSKHKPARVIHPDNLPGAPVELRRKTTPHQGSGTLHMRPRPLLLQPSAPLLPLRALATAALSACHGGFTL